MDNSDSNHHFLDDPFLNDSPPPPEKSSPPPPPSKAPPPPDSSPPPPDEISSPPPPAAATRTPPSQSTSPPPPEKGFNNNPPPKNSNNNSPALNDRLLPPPPPPSLRNNTLADEHVTNSSSSGNNHHLPVIVGFSIAGGLLLVLLIVCCVCCKRKKKQRPYYYDQERPPNGPFYNGTAQWNKNPHSMEMGMKIPPPPYGSGQWGATPSPRGNYSGENSSSGYYPSGQNPPLSIPPHSSSNMSGLGFSSQSQFSYEDLAKATNGFSQANLLGQGGFGYVYKGVLPDGKIVAVKSLKSGSGQGEREFQAEVEIISRVHHRHLVSLVGYCIADGQRMLVYEFVSNSTMEHHLHGKGQPVMDWSSRMRIAIGSAKGLAYLHEDCHPRIIHRDIKAANILLDDNYEAMVADFGLAKLTTDNATHVSTRVMGTFGYLAPEYASSGKLTEKSDVFSFGVMLLELITGHRPVDLTGQIMEDSLVDWARPYLAQALEDGNYSELADPKMEGNYAPNEMASMISCAAASIRHSGRRRAKMSQIVRALEGGSILSEETTEIKKTTRNNNASGSNNHDNNTYDTVAYNADIKKFRNMVIMDDETN